MPAWTNWSWSNLSTVSEWLDTSLFKMSSICWYIPPKKLKFKFLFSLASFKVLNDQMVNSHLFATLSPSDEFITRFLWYLKQHKKTNVNSKTAVYSYFFFMFSNAVTKDSNIRESVNYAWFMRRSAWLHENYISMQDQCLQ